MADYYPVLARAIAGLNPNTRDARVEVYERARAAITRQLAALDPPPAAEIIDREIANLEAVIDRLEEEFHQPSAVPPTADPEPPLAPPVPPGPARPQVMPKRAETGRKPWVGVAIALGGVVVAVIATMAYLRRHELPAMASRPLQGQSAQVEQRPQAVAKADDRVVAGAAEPPARPATTPPPPPPTQAAPAPPVARPTPATPAPPPQPPAQVPVTTAPPPPPAQPPAIAVANRLVFVAEAAEAGQPLQIRQGTVVWRTETMAQGQGQQAQLAIRAQMEVPDARLRADLTLQRNTDPALPASHTIQVQFQPMAGSDIRGVQSFSVMELRQTENQPGYAIVGQGIAVVENLFLIALAQAEPALSRNVEMLRTRPLVYFEFQITGGRRAAVIMEKGVSGQQAFDDAFRSWQ